MSVISLLLVLALIGVVAWALTSFVPMPAGIKSVIIVVSVIIAVIYALSALGVVGNLHSVQVPRVN